MTRLRLLMCAGSYSVRPEAMSGSGLRLLQVAGGLSPWCEVRLLLPTADNGADEDLAYPVMRDINDAVAWADALYVLDEHPDDLLVHGKARGCAIVCENHTPVEHCYYRMPGCWADDIHLGAVRRYREQLRLADLFIVRSDVERCSVIDGLIISGRVSASDLRLDESLRRLVQVVPIGVLESELDAMPEGMRDEPSEWPIEEGLWWNGGLWEFHDPVTLLRALAATRTRIGQFGITFPYLPSAADSPVLRSVLAEVEALNLAESVHLLSEQPDHRTRDSACSRAAAFVCVGRDSAENALCHRLRLRDTYLYRRPFIADAYGATGKFVAGTGIGVALADDVATAARQLSLLLSNRDYWNSCAAAIDRLLPSVLLDRHCERLARHIAAIAR
jgi:hypothetical protein